ncbi:MAG: amidohydrolase family protein [Candidatus Hydrogenedentes bacterium]|nr:amidohydrolase family protein [Candidatus Hydrogenedentota bacterium]
MSRHGVFLYLAILLICTGCQTAQQDRAHSYPRIKAEIDKVAIIDTHDHLWPFETLPIFSETDKGWGANLAGIWRNSYYAWNSPLASYAPKQPFAEWWAEAHDDFDNSRGMSFYRYMLPAFEDLYGVDFDSITPEQAQSLDNRIFENYKDQRWLYHVVTERANIELMFNDPYWARFKFETYYPFEVLVFNVTTLTNGFNPSEITNPNDSPFAFAKKEGLPTKTLDDYLAVLDRMFVKAKEAGAVCLKTTIAYERSLNFENVSRETAETVYGKVRSELSKEQITAFQDFIMWRLVELSAKHELPFQIHTGDARIQGSNPMLLVDLIQKNSKTKFILFHGGYPWIGETGVIMMRHGSHVWVDSCWLPTISYTMAKRAYQEWIDVMPSNRIMFGADTGSAEGIYGATEFGRRCIADALSEKVDKGDLSFDQAARIGRQILRENALELFPQLRSRLWKHKGPMHPR